MTLFHEFGHGLHHLLTRVDYPSIAGINGVAWDAVELPSQFMENYAWHPEVLRPHLRATSSSGAAAAGRARSAQLIATRSFHAGLQTLRQLEFALFDFRLHAEYDPARGGRVLRDPAPRCAREVAVVPVPEWNRFPHSFGHIFAGGYAAGYYSYKWAEVLAADAFAAFEETGVFDRAHRAALPRRDPAPRRQPRCARGLRRVPRPPAGRARAAEAARHPAPATAPHAREACSAAQGLRALLGALLGRRRARRARRRSART